MVDRLPDWLPRLSDYIASVRRTPFEHGQFDCALFAAGAVLAMTGADPAATYRGTYSTFLGGIRQLQLDGAQDHIEKAIELFPAHHWSTALTGDLAIAETGNGLALGVVSRARIFLVGEHGLYTVDLSAAKKVLKV